MTVSYIDLSIILIYLIIIALVGALSGGKQKSTTDYFMGGKKPLLNNGHKKAINILRNKPNSWVFLVPDLYPQNMPFAHSTYDELKRELEKRFRSELKRKKCDDRLKERFLVHCFKYDLEVLLLA